MLLSPLQLFLFSLVPRALSLVIYPEALLPPSTSPLPTFASSSSDDTPLPLVIWHGLGDSFDADGIKDIAELADAINPGTYTYAIHLADDGSSDRSDTFFGNVTKQIDDVCAQLAKDPILSTAPAIDALGFSQGGQFLRGYVERCNNPPVRNLITFGSQHNGISEFQNCKSATDFVCQGANALLKFGTWSNYVQSRLVPAQYYRDPEHLDDYLAHSNFLADINNERLSKNTTYKKNLASLETLVMYVFKDDLTVVPKETAWFSEVNRTSGEVTPLKERKIYTEDWIGLKQLDGRGSLVFKTIEGAHMALTDKVLNATFKTYFGPLKEKKQRHDDDGLFWIQEEL